TRRKIVSFHEELLRFVVAPAKFSFRCLAVDDVSRKSFHNPINGWKVTASVLLFMLAFTSTTAVSQQPTIVQQTTTAQPTAAGQQTAAPLPNPLTLSQAVTIALSNNSIVRQAQARLSQASGQYAQSR